MLINTTILLEHLQEFHPTKHQIISEDKLKLYLCNSVLYENETLFEDDKVYIAQASELTSSPAFKNQPAILCIGNPCDIYWNSTCNIICFPEGTTIASLLNAVQGIFRYYESWDYKLRSLVFADAALKELAEISLPVFKNPIAFHDRNHRSIFLVTDFSKRALPADAIMKDNEYMPLEETNVLLMDPEYNDLINHREPTLLSDNLYSYKTIVQNIFLKNEFLGRICLYNIYRPFKNSDYSALTNLAEYIKITIERQDMLKEITPTSIRTALSELLKHRTYDQHLLDTALHSINWNQHDTYLCTKMSVPAFAHMNPVLEFDSKNETASISTIFMYSCTLKHENGTILLINVTKCNISRDKIIDELDHYFKEKELYGGISIEFSDIRQLPYFYEQADIAHKHIIYQEKPSCHTFDTHILSFTADNCLKNTILNTYIPEGLYKLINYDKANKTDYCHLLKVYLSNNMNIAQTVRLLYIHRSTFLYRIQKITQILDCDLENYKNRLALQIAFMLISYTKETDK